MRPVVKAFLADVAEELPLLEPIVEIGARPAEGQEGMADLRGLFKGREYIACDLQAGPGVDRLEDVHALSFPDASVGTVLAADTLEHVADPIRALQEIHRVLRPGGTVAITSVMFFVIHAHPWDYWRFTPEGFERLLEPFDERFVTAHGWASMPETVLGLGRKAPVDGPPVDLDRLPRTAALVRTWGAGTSVDLGPMRMTVPELWRFTARQTLAALRRRPGGRA
jgi:SAM-dependent methyltransferase